MITFTHGSTSVVLPNPTLGDARQLEIPKTIRRAMSGKMYSYVTKLHPTKWILQFNRLEQKHVDDLTTFLQETNGDDILFTDWLARNYSVKIVSNPLQFTQNLNFFTATIELRGYDA